MHYEFTGKQKVITVTTRTGFRLITLHQIRATNKIEFETQGMVCVVKKGEIGGWIESEENLPQNWNTWVDKKSEVYGGAVIQNDSIIIKSTLQGNIICQNGSTISNSIIVKGTEDRAPYYISSSNISDSQIDSPIKFECVTSKISNVEANEESTLTLYDGVSLKNCKKPKISMFGNIQFEKCVFDDMVTGQNVSGEILSTTFHTPIELNGKMNIRFSEFTNIYLLDGTIELAHVKIHAQMEGSITNDANWYGVVLNVKELIVQGRTELNNVFSKFVNYLYMYTELTLRDVKMLGTEELNLKVTFMGTKNFLVANEEDKKGEDGVIHEILLTGKEIEFRNSVIFDSPMIFGRKVSLSNVHMKGYTQLKSESKHLVSFKSVKMEDYSSIFISDEETEKRMISSKTLQNDDRLCY